MRIFKIKLNINIICVIGWIFRKLCHYILFSGDVGLDNAKEIIIAIDIHMFQQIVETPLKA